MNTTIKIILVVIVISISSRTVAQEKFYASTTIQMIGSSYNENSHQNSYYVYGGLKYQAEQYYLSVSMPIVFSNKNLFTQLGNTFLQNNHNDTGENNLPTSNTGHMGSSSNGMMSPSSIGLGDLYLNGSFTVLEELDALPIISVDGYIKIPTATENLGIGTGEFDYQIALGLKKYFNRVSVFGQLGYLMFGSDNTDEIQNPITVSLSVGYIFGAHRHSVMIGYDSYSTIVKGLSSPQQLAFGYNYLLSPGVLITSILSIGLNNATSDYTISGGMNFEI